MKTKGEYPILGFLKRIIKKIEDELDEKENQNPMKNLFIVGEI